MSDNFSTSSSRAPIRKTPLRFGEDINHVPFYDFSELIAEVCLYVKCQEDVDALTERLRKEYLNEQNV